MEHYPAARPEGSPDSAMPGRCSYCGAPLDRRYYFCRSCSVAYRDPETFLPAVPPGTPTDGARVKQRAPEVSGMIASMVTALVITMFLSLAFFPSDRPELSLFLGSCGFLAVTCVYALRDPEVVITPLKKAGLRPEVLTGLLLLVPLLALNAGYHGLLRYLAGPAMKDPFESITETGLSKATLVGLLCVFPGIFEEIGFRGLVQGKLLRAVSPGKALLYSSALFSAVHLSILSAPYLFLVGLLLGWTRQKTGSLYPPMVLHFLHNFLVLEVLTVAW